MRTQLIDKRAYRLRPSPGATEQIELIPVVPLSQAQSGALLITLFDKGSPFTGTVQVVWENVLSINGEIFSAGDHAIFTISDSTPYGQLFMLPLGINEPLSCEGRLSLRAYGDSNQNNPSVDVTLSVDIETFETASPIGGVQTLSRTISLAELQTGGAVSTAAFNFNSPLPANAVVVSSEVEITTDLSLTGGVSLSSDFESPGTLLNLAQSSVGKYGYLCDTNGGQPTNVRPSRAGERLAVTVALDAGNLEDLTTGDLIVRVVYAAVPS